MATEIKVVKPSIFKRVLAKLKLWSAEFAKDEPQIERAALATLEVLAPLAATIVSLVEPAAAPLVAPIVSRVTAGLAALTVTVEDAGGLPTLSSIVDSVVSNLGELESVAGVKDAKTQGIVETITTELQTIVAEFQSSAAAVITTEAPTA